MPLFCKVICPFLLSSGFMVWTMLLDDIAPQYAGRIRLHKLNTDDYPQIATFHGIDRIPTVLLFKNGEKLKSITGTLPKSVYVEAIEHLLSH